MTLSEQQYLDRLRTIRSPKASSGGKKGGGILGALLGLGGLSGLSGAIPVDAPQGPLPSGGNLNQGDPVGGTFSGGPGTPALALGNPNREQIKIGPFFKPRVDQEAAARLAQDPLAPVQLEKPTTGVGGFFRRMLGDDANERNAARVGMQEQLRLQKWLIDQQSQSRLGLLDREHQLQLERLKTASNLNNEETQYRTQLGLQGKQLENQWALQQEAEKTRQARAARFDELTGIVGDPIRASMLQEQMLTAPLDKLAAETAEANARAQGTGGFAPRPVQSRPAPTGYKAITETLIQDNVTGNLLNYDPETGTMTPIGFGGAQGGLDPAALAKVDAGIKAKELENIMAELNAEPTVLGGLKVLGGEAMQGAVGLGKSAFNTAFPSVATVTQAAKEAYNPVANWLKEKARLEQDRKRKIFESQNPQLFE